MTRVPKAWMRGAGPLAVLELLDQREMYGYELAEALDRLSDGVLAMGHSTLYPLLYNLAGKGLVTQREARSEAGRTRRYYSLTPAGRDWLTENRREWTELVEAMGKLGLA